MLPAVIALLAENVGHVKAVAGMTQTDLDPVMGRAVAADGVGTVIASAVGGAPTTTYAENIGVMAATRVYSTAAYYVAAAVAILLGLVPKFGQIVNATPPAVLGGITLVLYGMIGLLGAKIWKENNVDFGKPVNLVAGRGGPDHGHRPRHRQVLPDQRQLHPGRHRGRARSSSSSATTWVGPSPPRTSTRARCSPSDSPARTSRTTPHRTTPLASTEETVKPAPFAYRRPASLPEALAALAGEPNAKVLAGGQSLVPLLSMRLAAPSLLVDINGLPGLADDHCRGR